MMVSPRQSPEDYKCDIKVGPSSNSWSASNPKIRIEDLVTFSHFIKDKVLNTLPYRIPFYICKLTIGLT